MISALPEMSPLSNASSYVTYTAMLKGDFNNFRKMLINLGGVPYLEGIEEIYIQQYSETLEYKLRIVVALGN